MGPSRRHASQRPLPGCRSHFDLHRFSWKLSGSYPSVLTGWLQWPVSVGYSGQGELNPCHNHSVILGSLFAALLCVCQLCGQDTEYQKLSIRKCHVMLIYSVSAPNPTSSSECFRREISIQGSAHLVPGCPFVHQVSLFREEAEPPIVLPQVWKNYLGNKIQF